ncbi:MAG: hypothetical protein V3V02_08440 [Rhizobiaceae bacterium]
MTATLPTELKNLNLKWLMLLALLLLAGCTSDTTTWHQKFTVTVETPDGIKTGSSVIEVRYAYSGPRSMGNVHAIGFTGEAVVVDLGQGQKLFALVVREDMKLDIFGIYKQALGGVRRDYQVLAPLIIAHREKVDIPHERLPMLVTFGDINNPASVEKVNPNKLSASFGAGYWLKSVTLQVTDEPVTKGVVEGVLGWMKQKTIDEMWFDLSSEAKQAIMGMRQPVRR